MDFFGHDKISDESMLLFLDFNTIFVKCKVFNTLKTCLNKDMFQKMSKKVAEKNRENFKFTEQIKWFDEIF